MVCTHAVLRIALSASRDTLVEKLSEKGFVQLRTEKKGVAGKVLAAFIANFRQRRN